MTLQEQVCTLEQAKRLKELGCEQNAYFTWYEFLMKDNSLRYIISSDTKDAIGNNDWCSAYAVAELGEMLTKAFGYAKTIRMPQVKAYDEGLDWWHPYLKDNGNYISFPAEAQARAALLIHILEQEKEYVH